MIKKIFLGIAVIGVTAITGCSGKTGTLDDTKHMETENTVMGDQLVSKEYLIEHCSLTDAQVDGADLDAFISEFEITYDNIDDFNIAFVLQDYCDQAPLSDLAYSYLATAGEMDAQLSEEAMLQQKTMAYYVNDGSYQESMVFDFEKSEAYYGKAVNLISDGAWPTKQISMTEDMVRVILNAQKEAGITQWKKRYEGTSEGTTGNFHWILYLECYDGEIYSYSGNGVLGQSTPDTYDDFIRALKALFEGE